MAEPTVVVGGTMAALAAADALAGTGHPVELLVPARGLGAGFAALQVDGRHLPLGFRVLELVVDADHPRRPPPIEGYTPGVANHRDWLGLLDDWFAELLGPDRRELGPPELVLGGRWGGDVHYTLDAWPLHDLLRPEQRVAIEREAREAAARRGPAGTLADPASPCLWDVDVATASLADHGPTLHGLVVEPVTRKIRADGGADVPVALRRKLWQPLFWPETIADVAGGREPSWRPTHRRFHDWGGRDGVLALLARLGAAGVVPRTVAPLAGLATARGRTELRFADGHVVSCRRPVLGVPAGELAAAVGGQYKPAQLTSVLAWVEVAEDDLLRDPSIVMLADPGVPAFRISAGGSTPVPGARLFTVELSHDVPDGAIGAVAVETLIHVGILREGAPSTVVKAHRGLSFTDPTMAARHAWQVAHERWLDAGVDAHVIGGAAAFAADSLNEQVVQGLWAAALARAGAPAFAPAA